MTTFNLTFPQTRAFDSLREGAEACMRLGDQREAIRLWIKIASLLGEQTPEEVYHRLGVAYGSLQDCFGGNEEENRTRGDCHKHAVLRQLHDRLEPDLYLEIGVDQGQSLALARGRAIGIDARPNLSLTVPLSFTARIIAQSSDSFFRDQAASLLEPPPDLVFIDGMHLFEFALRDFRNVERLAHPATLIVIDDIYPCHPAQATRLPFTGSWTGDVWKLLPILQRWRPDLSLMTLDAQGTGLLLVTGLNPGNQVLWHEYDGIVSEYLSIQQPPAEILDREGALASDNPLLTQWLRMMPRARKEGWTGERLQAELIGITY
jgi:hypothetical protein